MGIKKLTPTSPARRYQTYLTRDELTPNAEPEKSLLQPKTRISGRNNDGRITVRRRGGGHKRFYRIVDFKRDKAGIPGRITQIEYDPNRSAHIALVTYLDGEKRYIIAPTGLEVGKTVMSGHSSGCLRAKFEEFPSSAWRPSGRLATSNMKMSRLVKRAVHAGREFGRMFAVLQ